MGQAYYAGSSLRPSPTSSQEGTYRTGVPTDVGWFLGYLLIAASVGVTISDATEVDAVLREADVAMYTARARGKGRFELAPAFAQAIELDTVGTIPET
jgi:hypothetical protein